MKTKIYNLIILDESGSMQCVGPQTISGCIVSFCPFIFQSNKSACEPVSISSKRNIVSSCSHINNQSGLM